MLREDIKKKILSKNSKADLSKSAVMYMVASIFIFSVAGFYISSQIKHLVEVGNNLIVRIKAKTVVKFRIAKACKDAIIPPSQR